jgi:methyltransferase
VFHPTGPRPQTLSVALPGSIIANAKSHDAKTCLAGTIARALAVFCVDEVVIFDDSPSSTPPAHPGPDEYTAFSQPSHFLAHILSYLETPPHLRKALFPMHPNLRTAGTLPSLDMPHHLRTSEHCPYREGASVPAPEYARSDGEPNETYVDVGLPFPVLIPSLALPPSTRVTVRLAHPDDPASTANAVAPSVPRERDGYYWGYSVRRAPSLSACFTECPFPGGYELCIGTSERGKPITHYLPPSPPSPSRPSHTRVLVVFGGVAGLEHAASADPELRSKGVGPGNVHELFDWWVNVLPGGVQGSRTVRTEEAVWLGCMAVQQAIGISECAM